MELIVLFLGAALLAGCQTDTLYSDYQPISPTDKLISVYDLAAKIGLQVQHVKAADITLRNSTNTVMIFPYPGGQVFVNGRSVTKIDKVEKIGSSVYFPGSLVGKIRSSLRTGVARPMKTLTGNIVVIDAGHGGKHPGATSVLGYHEKHINLRIAQKVASSLRSKGANVVMTRNSDRLVELEDRAAIANNHNAKLFVSIHADSNPNHSRQGYTVYIARSASWGSKITAQTLVKSLSATGLKSNGVGRADYRVLVKTRCPAVLIETGHLSNSYEASILNRDSFQSKMAAAITNGISAALGKL
jgi:N-acetylmuramoyl-L-alanine amidase